MVGRVASFYQYFYSKVSGKNEYRFCPSSSDISMMKSFISMTRVGDEFLFKYFAYQFHYWHDKDTRFGKGRIPLNWVIGKKAFDRWSDNKDNHWYRYSTDLHNKFGINKSDIVLNNSLESVAPSSVEVPTPHEDRDRGLYHNTGKGLLMCSDYTSMYHPSSDWCGCCINSNDCKLIMEAKYPKMYRRRVNGQW